MRQSCALLCSLDTGFMHYICMVRSVYTLLTSNPSSAVRVTLSLPRLVGLLFSLRNTSGYINICYIFVFFLFEFVFCLVLNKCVCEVLGYVFMCGGGGLGWWWWAWVCEGRGMGVWGGGWEVSYCRSLFLLVRGCSFSTLCFLFLVA